MTAAWVDSVEDEVDSLAAVDYSDAQEVVCSAVGLAEAPEGDYSEEDLEVVG